MRLRGRVGGAAAAAASMYEDMVCGDGAATMGRQGAQIVSLLPGAR